MSISFDILPIKKILAKKSQSFKETVIAKSHDSRIVLVDDVFSIRSPSGVFRFDVDPKAFCMSVMERFEILDPIPQLYMKNRFVPKCTNNRQGKSL